MQNQDELISSLYQTEYIKLCKAAFRMTGDSELAMDLVQDVFLLALSHQNELSLHPKPAAWLMLTLQNLIKNERRKFANVNELVSLDDILELPSDKPAEPLSEMLPSQLSQDEKNILIWRYELKLDYREIAERLGISETGCRSRVFRVIAKCRKFLKDF